MRDPALIVKDLLEVADVGQFAATSGWCLCLGDPPDAPDSVVLVNQTGGLNPYPHLLINQPSVQVLVRGTRNGYSVAREKIDEVTRVLLGIYTYVDPVSGDTYRSCIQLGDVSYLGRDDNTRTMFSANFRFIVEPVEAVGSRRIAIT